MFYFNLYEGRIMYIERKKILIGMTVIFLCLGGVVGLCMKKNIDSIDKFLYKVTNKLSDLELLDRYYADKYPIEDKFWLHRTDTIEKLTTKGMKYKGVELDIVYYEEKDAFDNSHDRVADIKYPLENMLEILGHNQQNIWLDFKNLTTENASAALNRLEEILALYSVDKGRCIVESNNYRDLKLFHDKGFYTSFYVPVDDKYLKNSAERENFKAVLRQVVATGNVDAVSFPVGYYELIKEADIAKDLLLWDTSSKWWGFFLEPVRNVIRQDDAVKVILVKDYAKFER